MVHGLAQGRLVVLLLVGVVHVRSMRYFSACLPLNRTQCAVSHDKAQSVVTESWLQLSLLLLLLFLFSPACLACLVCPARCQS